ncbi:MAG: hypothetical protein AAF589_08710, partial [Planctomycetota bacterium]
MRILRLVNGVVGCQRAADYSTAPADDGRRMVGKAARALVLGVAMRIDWTIELEDSRRHTVLAASRGLPLIDPALSAAIKAGDDAIRAVLAPRGKQAFLDEMRLRTGPLRGQWEARGPGLMRLIGQLAPPVAANETNRVSLVTPVVGGHGDVLEGRVTIEAVLANPHAELPEALRLAWLLARVGAGEPADAAAV